jgi:hypothetical protein
MMKRLIFSVCILFLFITGYSQANRADVLQKLENNQVTDQNTIKTATIKSATRLFRDKDDLTSVIIVIPADSTVNVLGSDDTFLNVSFEGIDGYIYARHAEVNKPVAVTKPAPVQVQQEINDERYARGDRPVQQRQRVSRFDYLMDKYETSVATRIYAGKIWKGMTAQMVKDSWGSPKKINRIINGNNIREEWIFQSTWLYLQNDELVEWGPTK